MQSGRHAPREEGNKPVLMPIEEALLNFPRALRGILGADRPNLKGLRRKAASNRVLSQHF